MVKKLNLDEILGLAERATRWNRTHQNIISQTKYVGLVSELGFVEIGARRYRDVSKTKYDIWVSADREGISSNKFACVGPAHQIYGEVKKAYERIEEIYNDYREPTKKIGINKKLKEVRAFLDQK